MSSVTLVHPAKAVGQNEMPFGSDTGVVPAVTLYYTGAPVPPREGEDLGVGNPQFTAMPPNAKLNYFGRCYYSNKTHQVRRNVASP